MASEVARGRITRHLVAAGRLVDEDPQALEQARAARALGRVGAVREASGGRGRAAAVAGDRIGPG